MAYTAQTALRGRGTGDPGALASWAIAQGAARPDDLRAYLTALYRYAAAAGIDAGMAGSADVLADLAGTWAADRQYGEKIARTLNQLDAAGLLDGTPAQEEPMAVHFEKRIAKGRFDEYAALRDKAAWWTIHENGNEGSSPFDEARFVAGGGGSGRVMYHFAVGVENGRPTIVQIFPVNKRGKHAGNAEGNAKSIAVETCQAPPGATSAMTQEALRELGHMLYTGDKRIEGIEDHTFSPDRTCGHKDWPGANPGCPEYMTRAWGGVVPVVKAMRERLAAGEGPTGPAPYAKPIPLAELASEGVPPTLVTFDGSDFVYVNRMVAATKDTPRLQKAYASAERVGPDIKAGERFMVDRLFKADDGEWYYVTPWWTRVRYADTEPVAEEAEAA